MFQKGLSIGKRSETNNDKRRRKVGRGTRKGRERGRENLKDIRCEETDKELSRLSAPGSSVQT